MCMPILSRNTSWAIKIINEKAYVNIILMLNHLTLLFDSKGKGTFRLN